jgi:general secretion pathway protein J
MMRYRARRLAGIAGFTLIEALVATALMGVVLTSLASLAGQWLPNWNRGIARAQSSELIGVALDRLVGDVAASQFITAGRDAKNPLFDGTPSAVIFVRTALGPNARPGLEIVRIAEIKDGNGAALVRSMAPFTPLAMNGDTPILPRFADPIALVRLPYRFSFSYAGSDGAWKNTWQNETQLPTVVRMTVREGDSGRPLSVSTAALVHVDLPVSCLPKSGQDQPVPGQPGQAGQGQAAQGQPDQAQAQQGQVQQAQGQQGLPGQQGPQGQGDCNIAAAASAPEQNDPAAAASRRDL